MALILQFQRRAIERLRQFSNPISDPAARCKKIVLTGGSPLFILGVSDGVGSCSDIHGLNVLVVGEKPNAFSAHLTGKAELIRKCSYAVLLRPADDQECRERGFDPKLSGCNCVELLEVAMVQGETLVLKKTGKKTVYVSVV